MSEAPILFSSANGIAEVVLNRPEKRNALNPEMIVRLARAWDAIAEDPAIRIAILSGRGDGTFCAGADLGRLTPLLTRARPAEDEWDEAMLAEPKILNRAMLRRNDFFTPVIGAMRGNIVAGGMELALACDLRIVAEDSQLGLLEVQRGLIPAAGGVARVSRQVSWAAAAEILLVGDRISASEALRIGLVNRAVPAGEVETTARAMAERMARNSPLAMRKAKECMVAASGASLDEAFGVEDASIKVLLRSEDAREGSRAFMEKRTPRFTGR
ncbi:MULTISPECIES: enoyl-CoA hydratase-related protein [unclassified Chelatococcus]|uniref:enoyl-CoA hydratase/isomerase family protein n=1 Tax=unclassified Chelatococcus TaxID=2638111 RepID=UPI001BCFDBF7|nr:enoyl-CoA hydratase-related protein [Chelatococcus sp.]MBS7742635.1 enoyl-CoA hydratase/isomerase family protein [Chelatococcus sp. HY11]CAH1655260.1 Crotonase/enoyl-CoA hydratase family protein [Hyphomicrobiales bacterium]MBX3542247.1 enoyl-CoA hydratase/isomerase family protein [Chelatococcus sp.]MCO5075537.1 enoyl-CoA hydratase-related protein [Chelatococcus sp.]CAH1695395.1 Crotonase/enoyl-CoA hydratase family protein [Hyphomicrobiales bacterium]